jgi:hypothetical protein
MALKPLNSLNGFSVGDTGNVVVYANLDIVGNTITADSNLIGNGLLVNGVSNLSAIGNVRITGGSTGQVIQTDGNGNLSFASISTNSAAQMPYYVPVGESYIVNENFQGLFVEPIEIDGEFEVDGILIDMSGSGGANVNAATTQVLFASNGNAIGNTGFTFDSASGNLNLPGNVDIVGNLLPNANITYNLGSSTKRWNNLYLAGNTIYLGTGVIGTDANGDISLTSANGGQLIVAGNANFTSIENGNSNISITANGNVVTSVGGNSSIFIVTDVGANVFGTLTSTGNITAPTFIGNLQGNISGNIVVPGSNTSVLFNNQGNAGASNNLTFNTATNVLTVTGNVVANNANIGNLVTVSANLGNSVSANYLISSSGCVLVGTGAVAVIGNTAGIFNSAITDINLGLVANVTIGSTTGTTTVRNDLDVSGVIDSPSIMVGDLYSRRTAVPVTVNTVIDSFPIADFRSAKYTIRAGDDSGYQAIEVLLVHNNINSIITVYGSLSTTNADLVTLTTGINSGNVELKATGIGANTTVNLMGTYVPD